METDLVGNLLNATGSMMDVPKSLLAEIKALEEQLTVKTDKLKAITDHFVKELEKGKSVPKL
jgi:hexokinase